jgi:hypothetical protein
MKGGVSCFVLSINILAPMIALGSFWTGTPAARLAWLLFSPGN